MNHAFRHNPLMPILTALILTTTPSITHAEISFLTGTAHLTLTDGATSASTAVGIDVHVGDLVVVFVSYSYGAGTHVTTVSDAAGNVFTSSGSGCSTHVLNSDGIEAWYSHATRASSSDIVTATFSAASVNPTVSVVTYNGQAPGAPNETCAVGTTLSGLSVTSGTFSPAAANDVSVAFLLTNNCNALSSPGAGYLSRPVDDGASYVGCLNIEDNVKAPAGPQTASAAISSPDQLLMSVITFKPANDPPGATVIAPVYTKTAQTLQSAITTLSNSCTAAPAALVVDFGIGCDASAARDPTLASTISSAQSLGIPVYGYITSRYACVVSGESSDCGQSVCDTIPHDLTGMGQYIRNWYNWYNVNGIFFDEGLKSTDPNVHAYYLSLYQYVKSVITTGVRGRTVIVNMSGHQQDPDVFGLADVVVLWEGPCSDYLGTPPVFNEPDASFFTPTPRTASNTYMLANQCSSGQVAPIMQLLGDAAHNAGNQYVYDASTYDHLSPYVGTECSASCPSGSTLCSGACVNTLTDGSNCGTCGHSCQYGCSNGQCLSCPSGQTSCSGSCVNLLTDSSNCGTCGHSCLYGCTNGQCNPCPPGQGLCSGVCVNFSTDNNNCGRCGNSCGPSRACANGTCVCSYPWVTCDGRCYYLHCP